MNLRILFPIYIVAALMLLAACNKDDIIEGMLKPGIELDSDTGVYTVKIGHTLTIAPVFSNAGDAVIEWRSDENVLLATGPVWEAEWNELGTFYVTVSATNGGGTAEEDIRIDVLELTPPVISLALPEGGLKVMSGTSCLLEPDYLHDDMEGFAVRWFVDGVLECNSPDFTFIRTEAGRYTVRIEAENEDGQSWAEFTVEVLDSAFYVVCFPTPSYYITTTTRYTFAGRPLFISPIIEGFVNAEFEWSVDGDPAGCEGPEFCFVAESPGEYMVSVSVRDCGSESFSPLTRNARIAPDAVSAELKVVCVDADEAGRMRAASATSSPTSDKVYEYVPAPGQFINEPAMGDAALSHDAICQWAEERMKKRYAVSLGAFGGYIIAGFDHSVRSSESDYDFAIEGNAFINASGNSNEPGIVWVMQDVNGNGLPDDEWYELKGSEYDVPTTLRNYSVTYYRPAAPGMDVEWTDSEGERGSVDYLEATHKQDYYYPQWISASSYTLYGPRIASRNVFDPVDGFWANNPYGWGYADNLGSDKVEGLAGQYIGFRISNAVFADGSPANLKYVDFIKVQVAVQAKSGWLGELSTEVLEIRDLN